MFTILDLGALSIAHASAGLTCTLNNTAKIACFDEDGDAMFNIESAEQLIFGDFWMTKGANLRMILDLEWSTELNLAGDATVVRSDVVHALQDAALWKQLHFSPSITLEADDRANHLGRVTITLTYQQLQHQSAASNPRRGLHRLGIDVPYTDTRPSFGPRITLDEVHLMYRLFADVTRTKSCQLLPLVSSQGQACFQQATSDSPNDFIKYTQSFDEEHMLFDPESIHMENFPDSLLDEDLTAYLDPYRSSEHGLADVFEHDAVTTHVCHGADSVYATGTHGALMVSTILQILDAGLRRSISASPGRISKDLKVIEAMSFHTLAGIAPSLWCPGFIQAIGARSVFVPTLSHALSHVALASKSSLLRDKVQEILRQDLSGLRASECEADDTQRVLAKRFWQVLQKGTYGSPASRRLQAMDVISKTPREFSSDFEQLKSTGLFTAHERGRLESECSMASAISKDRFPDGEYSMINMLGNDSEADDCYFFDLLDGVGPVENMHDGVVSAASAAIGWGLPLSSPVMWNSQVTHTRMDQDALQTTARTQESNEEPGFWLDSLKN